MGNPNPKTDHLTPWQPGQSGNPKGKPKGSIHLSTHIDNMLHDPEFTEYLSEAEKRNITFKGAPVKAIIATAIIKAIENDAAAREWLAKHGYGTKLKIETDDPLAKILAKFGISEAEDDAGEIEGTTSGAPEERS